MAEALFQSWSSQLFLCVGQQKLWSKLGIQKVLGFFVPNPLSVLYLHFLDTGCIEGREEESTQEKKLGQSTRDFARREKLTQQPNLTNKH